MNTLYIIYQKVISRLIHAIVPFGGCRYQPTCSKYLVLATEKYGYGKGLLKFIKRFFSCNPLGKGGVDYP